MFGQLRFTNIYLVHVHALKYSSNFFSENVCLSFNNAELEKLSLGLQYEQISRVAFSVYVFSFLHGFIVLSWHIIIVNNSNSTS